MAVRGSITWKSKMWLKQKELHILTRYVNDGDDDNDEDQVAKELHPDDGVDEEEHSHEHADVW